MMEGRKRFWDNRLELSTLVVALHEPRPVIASAGGGPWRTLRQALGDAGDTPVSAATHASPLHRLTTRLSNSLQGDGAPLI